MKWKSSTARRLPVDFGTEPFRLIPVQIPASLCGWRPGGAVPVPIAISRIASVDADWDHEPVQPLTFQTIGQRFSLSRRERAGVRGSRSNENLAPIQGKFFGKRGHQRGKNGFTLVEILVVLALLSLIVFALMSVFNMTQRAFRNSLTSTDTLEGGRNVMDLITSDLESMIPSDNNCNLLQTANLSPVNFYAGQAFQGGMASRFAGVTSPPSPLIQPLISSPSGARRTNILEDIFMLSRGNINGVPTWIGAGYSVNTNLPDGTLYPLYRFYMTTNASAGPAGPVGLFNQFIIFQYTNSASWSHLLDGVVNLTARAYDTNGIWMTNGYANPSAFHVRFVRFNPAEATPTETDSFFYSNAVPASVEIQLATLEDHTLAHALGLSGINQSNYLAGAAGQLHVFRQRVWIRNLDLSAYQ